MDKLVNVNAGEIKTDGTLAISPKFKSEYSFELLRILTGETISITDIINLRIFDDIPQNAHDLYLPRKCNAYILNELKGYIQEKYLKQKKSFNYFTRSLTCINRIDRFIYEYYPQAVTIADISYEEFVENYRNFSIENNFPTSHKRSYKKKNGNIISFEADSKNMAVIKQFHAFILDNTKQRIAEENKHNLLFDVDDIFAGNIIDVTDERIASILKGIPSQRKLNIILKFKSNVMIENEIRGFIQYLVRDKNLTYYSLKTMIAACNVIDEFFYKIYPSCTSVIELDFQKGKREYKVFLEKNSKALFGSGTKTYCIRDDKVKKYYSQSHYLYIFDEIYDFVRRKQAGDILDNKKTFEKECDLWDLDATGIALINRETCSMKHLNFSRIRQDWFKSVIKEYCLIKLKEKSVSGVVRIVYDTTQFSEYLSANANIHGFEDIKRCDIEGYLGFLRMQGYKNNTVNTKYSLIKVMFEDCLYYDLIDIPLHKLFLSSDVGKQTKTYTVPYSKNEKLLILNNLHNLSPSVAAIIFVACNCGMRISEVLAAKILAGGEPAIIKDETGCYIFRFYLYKTSRFHSMPVSEKVGRVIEAAIKSSIKRFGAKALYVFSNSVGNKYTSDYIRDSFNNMANRLDLRDDNGNLLLMHTHRFRAAIETELANSGWDKTIIAMLIGQKSIASLNHYVEIHRSEMLEQIEDITSRSNAEILSIYEEKDSIDEAAADSCFIKLPNGYCKKSLAEGICDNANICYECPMFVPLKAYLNTYKQQLLETEKAIKEAKNQGYERVVEKSEYTRNALKKIIDDMTLI